MTAGWTVDARTPCQLCGDTTNTAPAVMRFQEPDEDGRRFTHGVRCRDHRACRDRYEAATGERYPLEGNPW